MKYRRLGSTDLEVSEISLGCWTLGGLNWHNGQPSGWADVDEDDAVEAIRYALDHGVNHFDNADVYGNGKAEQLLARALGDRNNKAVVATKVGWFSGTAAHAYEPLHIRHQCEQSLINLRRDHIDLYYFHHGDFGVNDRYLDEAAAMMLKLKEEGKIRYIGLSAYSSRDFLKLIPSVRPDVVQSWANILDDQFIRENMPVTRLMREHHISFVAFSPLAQGLLLDRYSSKAPPVFPEGDHRRTDKRFSQAYLSRLEPKMEKLKERFGRGADDLSRVALQYVLSHDTVGCVIPGFRNKAQVEQNLAQADKPLSGEDIRYIQDIFNA
ncbi:MAG: aldo/keto reductase [bacterium]|nr:aldo/keto reductase [bacterium]